MARCASAVSNHLLAGKSVGRNKSAQFRHRRIQKPELRGLVPAYLSFSV